MIDAAVAFIVIGGCLYALGALLVLGLCKTAAESDDAAHDAYLAAKYGLDEIEDERETQGREWIASLRETS
jgi:hypothetical protein